MDLETFILINRPIIIFVYGLTFFVLGLAIALQSRRYSRLDLARSLPWLAAFGFAHGFTEWGDLFVPIQSTWVSLPELTLLQSVQLLLLASSFACLFEFGVTILRPSRQTRLLHALPLGLLVGWIMLSFFVLLPLAPTLEEWRRLANALARYAIGFPGGLLAAWGLREQALRRIAPLNFPHIIRYLRVAGTALGLYAVFAGLIPPQIPVWPGTWLNSVSFEHAIGVTPAIFRSLLGAILVIAIIRALEVFELETAHLIESMEEQQVLAAERDRIARELHDGVIQKVYTAGLLIDSARKHTPEAGVLGERLRQSANVLNDAIVDLRRNLGELRAAPSGLDLAEALRRLARDPRFDPFVNIALEMDLPQAETISASRAEEVLAIAGEALSNTIRHARARRVQITVRRDDGRLKLSVADDGVGLPADIVPGSGLRNMRDRARMLNGQIEITGTRGKGTQVCLDVPWKDER